MLKNKLIIFSLILMIFSFKSQAEIGDIVVHGYLLVPSSFGIDFGKTRNFAGEFSYGQHVNVISVQEFGPFVLYKISYVPRSVEGIDSINFRNSVGNILTFGEKNVFFGIEKVRIIGSRVIIGSQSINYRSMSYQQALDKAKDIYVDYLIAEIERLKASRGKSVVRVRFENMIEELNRTFACRGLF